MQTLLILALKIIILWKVGNMTKLVFPSEGIKKNIKPNIDSTINYLNSASASAYFDIPSDFGYYNYLQDLKNTINSYKKESENILDISSKVDTNFDNLENELKKDAQLLPTNKMSARDRMIVL